jgi:hypothetical protein
MQLAIGDADVTCRGKQLMQQGSPLLIDAGVVRPQQRKEIALDLIGNHLNDVCEVLTFRGELDHGPLVEFSDFGALGNLATLVEESRQSARALRSCLPSLPWAILKPRMVGRRCSALFAAATPYSRSSLVRSARAARISLSNARRSGLGMVRVGSSGSIW